MTEGFLDNVYKSFGDSPAVRGVTLRLAPGEFVTLLGPSGCGKTTCLRMLAGFVTPTSGHVLINGADVTHVPPHRRNTGMVFQSYALFPHKTVAGNVAFGTQVRRLPRAEIQKRTKEALQLVRMEHLAERYPSQLSGGQKQRVALARAVAIQPSILLLDEPLAALDLKLREELQVEIKRIQTTLNITTLFVTHDQGEALGLSDRVAVMRDGEIVQIDTPTTLYDRPNSQYVANFVGRTNLLPVTVREVLGPGRYQVEAADGSRFLVEGKQTLSYALGQRCWLAARPEAFKLGAGHANTISATVCDRTYRGNVWSINARTSTGELVTVYGEFGQPAPVVNEALSLSWEPSRCFLLNEQDTVPRTASS